MYFPEPLFLLQAATYMCTLPALSAAAPMGRIAATPVQQGRATPAPTQASGPAAASLTGNSTHLSSPQRQIYELQEYHSDEWKVVSHGQTFYVVNGKKHGMIESFVKREKITIRDVSTNKGIYEMTETRNERPIKYNILDLRTGNVALHLRHESDAETRIMRAWKGQSEDGDSALTVEEAEDGSRFAIKSTSNGRPLAYVGDEHTNADKYLLFRKSMYRVEVMDKANVPLMLLMAIAIDELTTFEL